MSTAAAQSPKGLPPSKAPAQKHPISWEQFQKRYLHREDRFKYEWVNGFVEKTPRTMNQMPTLIWRNLKNVLAALSAQQGKPMGELMQEVHVYRGEGMTICKGKKLCSAAPVLPEFELPAIEIFDGKK